MPFALNDRVRITSDCHVHNLGSFPAGTTGTVTELFDDNEIPECEAIAYVKLDTRFLELLEWDNQLHIHRAGEGEVTWDYFGKVVG